MIKVGIKCRYVQLSTCCHKLFVKVGCQRVVYNKSNTWRGWCLFVFISRNNVHPKLIDLCNDLNIYDFRRRAIYKRFVWTVWAITHACMTFQFDLTPGQLFIAQSRNKNTVLSWAEGQGWCCNACIMQGSPMWSSVRHIANL